MILLFFGLLLKCCASTIRQSGIPQIIGPQGNDRFPVISKIDEFTLETHILKEAIPGLSKRRDIEKLRRSPSDHIHQVTFVIKQRNLEKLTSILNDISDPKSQNYGRYMTKTQVESMTLNSNSRHIIETYLQLKGVEVLADGAPNEYISAKATIVVWEQIFHTEFFIFHHTQEKTVREVVRAEKYSIPSELNAHVESVFNTIQMPQQLFGSLPVFQHVAQSTDKRMAAAGDPFYGLVIPAKLKTYYNISNTRGSVSSTQAVYSGSQEFFSPLNLKSFQSSFSPPAVPISDSIGNHSSDSACVASVSSCMRANIGVQYMMAMSQGSPTTFWQTDLSLSGWLASVAASPKPPLVLSISYGASESTISKSEIDAFTTQALKLSARGVTLVAASGDNGANSISARASGAGLKGCGYDAIFPASSPLVTAVGATSGVESLQPEVACQANLGRDITSGGGFSKLFPTPVYQTAAQVGYFQSTANSGKTPVNGFATSGSGYPDISVAGYKYIVRIAGGYYSMSSTVASAAVVAGMFSNVNAARIAAGKGPIGWINPTLYAYSNQFTNDITSGSNLCTSDTTCCTQGFYATQGWDPVTGLGSLDYARFVRVLVSLGNTTDSMALFPTQAPIAPTSSPTLSPTVRPSSVPTIASASPSTQKPSVHPTSAAPTPIPGTPTLNPTSAIVSNLQVSQTLSGVSTTDAVSPIFLAALSECLSVLLQVPASCITDIAATTRSGSSSASGSGSGSGGSAVLALASDSNIAYSINFAGGVTPGQLISKLTTSVKSGDFASILTEKSGVPIAGLSALAIVNLSPTPTPTTRYSEPDNLTVYSIVAGISIGGGILTISIAMLVCCCCCRKCRRRKNRIVITQDV